VLLGILSGTHSRELVASLGGRGQVDQGARPVHLFAGVAGLGAAGASLAMLYQQHMQIVPARLGFYHYVIAPALSRIDVLREGETVSRAERGW